MELSEASRGAPHSRQHTCTCLYIVGVLACKDSVRRYRCTKESMFGRVVDSVRYEIAMLSFRYEMSHGTER